MSSTFIVVLLSSALYIKRIDADVVILNTSEIAQQAVFECGRSLTLTCKFTKNTFAIVWKNAYDISSIATCIQNECAVDPMYDGQYIISFDKTSRIFNLTLIMVTMKDNGRRLVCSDGSHTDYTIIAVRDYTLDLIENKNSGTITASSGCVSQDTGVSFKWMKINACSSIENRFSPNIRFKHTTSCSNDFLCGNDQHIRYIEEIFISPNQYHLKVIAVYGHESKDSDEIVVKYIVPKGEKRSCHLQDKHSSGVIIICIAAVVAANGVGIIPLCMLIKKHSEMAVCQCEKLCINKIAKRPITQRDNAHEKVKHKRTRAQVSKKKERKVEEEEGGEELSSMI